MHSRLPTRTVDSLKFTKRSLKDINLGYSDSSSTLVIYGIDTINNMIENLCFTVAGEREFEPLFGTRIPYLLFDPCDETTAYLIETELWDKVPLFLPFITLNKQQSSVVPFINFDGYEVTVVYYWKAGGINANFYLPITTNF